MREEWKAIEGYEGLYQISNMGRVKSLKYGKEKMANIITFQTIGAKQSLRDIGRVFSFNNADINTLCMKIKGQNTSLDDSIKNNKPATTIKVIYTTSTQFTSNYFIIYIF